MRRWGAVGRMRGSRSGAGGSSASPLLDITDATFTRASEAAFVDPRQGWAFQAQGAGAWLAADTPRIFSDGSILVEEARTNVALRSSELGDAVWATSSSPTIESDAAAAPDGSLTADRITATTAPFGSRANNRVIQNLASGPAEGVLSAYLLAGTQNSGGGPSGDVQCSLIARTTDLSITDLSSAWQRYSVFHDASNLSQALFYVGGDFTVGPFAVGDNVLTSLFQAEAGPYPTSPIRTTGSDATRANDRITWAAGDVPVALREGVWSFTWQPWYSSDSVINRTDVRYLLGWGSQAAGVTVRGVAGGVRVAVYRNAGSLAVDRIVTWSAQSVLTITIDVPANEITLEGFDTGDGTYALSSPDWPGPSDSVHLAARPSDGGLNADGVYTLPLSIA
jgi:hypothetical protein